MVGNYGTWIHFADTPCNENILLLARCVATAVGTRWQNNNGFRNGRFDLARISKLSFWFSTETFEIKTTFSDRSLRALAGKTFEIIITFSNRNPKALAGEAFEIKITFSDRSPKALAGETFEIKNYIF